jgi:hypothetical protein
MTTFVTRKYISKYEQRMITIKEHQIHDMDNSPLYSRIESCDITKKYGIKLKYVFL